MANMMMPKTKMLLHRLRLICPASQGLCPCEVRVVGLAHYGKSTTSYYAKNYSINTNSYYNTLQLNQLYLNYQLEILPYSTLISKLSSYQLLNITLNLYPTTKKKPGSHQTFFYKIL
jgi:hypothetical protein